MNLMRSLLIALSKAGWAKRLVTRWSVAWRVASRFIAGEALDDALRVIGELNSRGMIATLDHLGENTTSEADAHQAVLDIFSALEAIERANLRSNVSVKLTQLGLNLDPQLAYRNLIQILDAARLSKNFIRIDMEDSSLTQITLDLVHRARTAGYTNVGTVIQSYLYRSDEDTRRLAKSLIPVRMVKGAYLEPPELAYPKKEQVNASFNRLIDLLIQAQTGLEAPPCDVDGRFPPMPAVASHDPLIIKAARESGERAGLAHNCLEFQLLYGIRSDLQKELIVNGYPVRVYVPYGTHWYPYFMRRLAERPANVWFFVSNFFRR